MHSPAASPRTSPPRGFSFDVELLVRLQAAGARIDEIPVTWTDVPGSTFVPARHGAGAFTELAAIAWRTRQLGAPVAGRATVSGALAVPHAAARPRRPAGRPGGSGCRVAAG